MLQIPFIREHSETIAARLAIRNMDAKPMINSVLDLDEKRRQLQTQLDSTKAELNSLSKQIGMLFKSGDVERQIP